MMRGLTAHTRPRPSLRAAGRGEGVSATGARLADVRGRVQRQVKATRCEGTLPAPGRLSQLQEVRGARVNAGTPGCHAR